MAGNTVGEMLMEPSLNWDNLLFILPLILGLLLGAWVSISQTLHVRTHISLQILSPKNPVLERLGHAFGLGLGLDSRVLCAVLLSSLGLCGLLLEGLIGPLFPQVWLSFPLSLALSLFMTAQIGQGMGHCFESMLELGGRD